MTVHRARLILVGLILVASSGCSANAREAWKLVQAVGEVSVAPPGGAPAKVTPVQDLPDGAAIATGMTGRAVLLRGRETIVMAPASKLTLPAGANTPLSHVKQDSGVLLFKIGKKPQAHFEVQTPYLAAVVKGTSFTVRVTAAGASVHVLEGAVDVATPDRSRAFLTKAGQISTVFAGAVNDIFTAGAAAISRIDLDLPASVWDIDRLDPDAMIGGFGEGLEEIAPQLWRKPGAAASTPEKSRTDKRGSGAPDGLRGTSKDEQNRKQRDVPEKPGAKETGAKEPQAGKLVGPADAPGNEQAATALPDGAAEKKRVSRTLRLGGIRGEISIDGMEVETKGPDRPKSLAAGSWITTGRDSDVSFKVGTAIFALTQNSVAVFDGPEGGEIPRVISGTGCRLDVNSRRFKPVNTMAEERTEYLNRKREEEGLVRVPTLSAATDKSPEALCDALDGPAEMARRWDEGEKRTGPRTLSTLDKLALGALGLGALGCLVMSAYPARTTRRTPGPGGGDRKASSPAWLKTILGR